MRVIVVPPGEGKALTVSEGGDHLRMKVAGGDSDGTVAAFEYWAAPHAPGPSAHTHQGHEEFWYILEETLHMAVGDDVVAAAPGTAVFVPRGVSHTFWNEGDRPCKFMAVFTPAGFEGIFEELQRMLAGGTELDAAAAQAFTRRWGMTVTGPPRQG